MAKIAQDVLGTHHHSFEHHNGCVPACTGCQGSQLYCIAAPPPQQQKQTCCANRWPWEASQPPSQLVLVVTCLADMSKQSGHWNLLPAPIALSYATVPKTCPPTCLASCSQGCSTPASHKCKQDPRSRVAQPSSQSKHCYIQHPL